MAKKTSRSAKKDQTTKTKKTAQLTRSHEFRSSFIKRLLAYSIFGIAILFLSILIFYRAKGYTFNNKGEVVKRGIVLVDSAPLEAKVFLDDKEEDKTEAKLEVDEGSHTIRLEAEGYRTWQHSFNIKSEQVLWLFYPYLIPNVLKAEPLLANQPSKKYSLQSSQDRVLTVLKASVPTGGEAFNFELLNLREDDPQKISQPIAVPSQLFTKGADGVLGELSFKEWSKDGDSLLVEHTTTVGQKELINIRPKNPAESLNITQSLQSSVSEAHFDDKSRLVLLMVNGELARYDVKNLQKELVISRGVHSFGVFDENRYIYIKDSTQNPEAHLDLFVSKEEAQAKLVKTIRHRDLAKTDYLYTINRRSGYLAFTDSSQRTFEVYKNPLDSIEATLEPIYLSTFESLQSPALKKSLAGSPQPGSYIALQLSGSKLFSYDFDQESGQSFDLKETSASQQIQDQTVQKELTVADIAWVDSQRLQARSLDGNIYYFDYDGNYLNLITSTNQEFSYFVRSKHKTISLTSTNGVTEDLNQTRFKP